MRTQLAPYLAEHGWAVTVYGRPGAVRQDDPERDPRVRSVLTRGIESKSASTLTYGLTSALHAIGHKPDVALIMNVANGYWIPLLRLRGIPVLINVDGMEWERAKWGRLAKLVFRIGAKLSARFANRLVFDAEAIAQRWRTEFFKDGAVIAYGGDPISELPVEPGLTHRGYALVVARFVPENTIPQFITAAEQISQTHDVVFVGSSGYGGEMEAQVQALVDTNPRAHWFGHVSDDTRLHALWQHAGVYFHGHSVGGTNPALVQAMACGAPIVARDTVFTREVLADAGRFTGPAPADIAAACLAVLNNPTEADRLADAAKARAAEAYTWESVNAAYERELAHLAQS